MKLRKLNPTTVKALLKQFGSHNKTAEALGITYRRYCQLRQSQERLSKRLAIIIDLYLGG